MSDFSFLALSGRRRGGMGRPDLQTYTRETRAQVHVYGVIYIYIMTWFAVLRRRAIETLARSED